MKKLFLLCLACTFFAIQPAASTEDDLTPEDKVWGLSLAWSMAKYNFADFYLVPDLDWDQTYRDFIPKVLATKTRLEYYYVLEEFYAHLKEGHTRITLPEDIRSERIMRPPLIVREFDHNAVVVNADVELAKQIPIGTVILEVDGIPSDEYVKRYAFPRIAQSTDHARWEFALSGQSGPGLGLIFKADASDITMKIGKPDGTVETLTVPRQTIGADKEWVVPYDSSLLTLEWLDGDIALVTMNSFNDPAIDDQFDEILPELKKARGLILDVRNNGGGNSNIGYYIISHLINEPTLTSTWETPEHIASFSVWGERDESKEAYFKGTATYKGEPDAIDPAAEEDRIVVPTVVLSSHRTYSAAEDFLVAIDGVPHVTLVGEPSAGSTGQPKWFALPGGGGGQVTTKHDSYADGKEFVGVGVQPDIFVTPSVEDFRAGRDPILEKAVEVIEAALAD